jgi:hypothetical protein
METQQIKYLAHWKCKKAHLMTCPNATFIGPKPWPKMWWKNGSNAPDLAFAFASSNQAKPMHSQKNRHGMYCSLDAAFPLAGRSLYARRAKTRVFESMAARIHRSLELLLCSGRPH